jgi:HlyD family secretion protein
MKITSVLKVIQSQFFFLIVLLSGCSKDNVIKPEVKPLMEAVYASGNVVAKNQYEVFSQAEGYVVERVVDDGIQVKKGDPIYILESGQQSSRFDLARKNYSIAAQNYASHSPVLREIVSALKTTESKMKFDSVNYARYKNLLERKATTTAEYERMRLSYENSTNEYQLQQSRYEKIKNQLYIELQNAKSQLEIAGNESGKYIVRSELDGKVFKTLKEKGELVRRGEAIAIVGNNNDFFIQLAVDELDIQRIKEGQKILVTIDAFPGKVFNGVVDKIYPIVNSQQQSVRVDGSLTDSMPGFFSGLALEANIIIRKNEKALVLPIKAIHGYDTVYLETDDDIKPTKVTTGIRTFEEVEVIKGIDSNSRVVVKN